VPTKLKSRFEALSHYYFWTIAKTQSVVDVTTWLGSYWKGRNIENLSDQDSIIFADAMVEGAQTSGIFSDRSGLERGTLGTRTRQAQFVRLWTTLISYMLRKGNIAYEKGVGFAKKPTIKGAAYLLSDYMLLFMVEGIASALVYGNWPGDDDEEESIAGWVTKATLDSIISGIPLVREIGTARYGSGNTPIGTLTKDIWDLGIQVDQGELDEAAIKTGVKVVGTLFHVPASQTNRAIDAYFEDDPELYEYIMGARRR
jgi:hypothetical protein